MLFCPLLYQLTPLVFQQSLELALADTLPTGNAFQLQLPVTHQGCYLLVEVRPEVLVSFLAELFLQGQGLGREFLDGHVVVELETVQEVIETRLNDQLWRSWQSPIATKSS